MYSTVIRCKVQYSIRLTTSCRCEDTLHYGPWLPEAAQTAALQMQRCRQQLPAPRPLLQQGEPNLSPQPPPQPLMGRPGPVDPSGPPRVPPAPGERALPCSAGAPGPADAPAGSGRFLTSADLLGHWGHPKNKKVCWWTR